jgi:NAD-dependent SIR2 family protein deacetylase
MAFNYEDIVMKTQRNYFRYYSLYASGKAPVELSQKTRSYEDNKAAILEIIRDADCILVGGASGLSAAGGGDFYYGASPSFRKYFGKFADKYGFCGAFDGMRVMSARSREEFWAYLATFLHTTQTAPVRRPYLDLDCILRGKDFFILTTNQDTQFTKLYEMDKVAEIQGDHRFFQCKNACHDELWDAVQPVREMMAAIGDGTSLPTDLIPHCSTCGAELFPWVRGYGNFMQESLYRDQYRKVSAYIDDHKDAKILFLELGVGRMTPMFIQEPFWQLTQALPQAHYISVNDTYAFLPKQIEDRGIAVKGDLAEILADLCKHHSENQSISA